MIFASEMGERFAGVVGIGGLAIIALFAIGGIISWLLKLWK